MRFIHIADVHLGAVPDASFPWGQDRKKDIYKTFEEVVQICNVEFVDLLLIAGDLFHKPPVDKELKQLDRILSRLEMTRTIIMAGNHDYLSYLSPYEQFKFQSNTTLIRDSMMTCVSDIGLKTNIYGLSYFSQEKPEGVYDFVQIQEPDEINILLAHGGDEKHVPIDMNMLKSCGFDYVALGHIHRPHMVEENKIAYAGALEPVKRSDIGPHGYILGNIDEKKQVKLEFHPVAKASYEEIHVVVTDETTQLDIIKEIEDTIKKKGTKCIYTIYIEGEQYEAVPYQLEEIEAQYRVLEIKDQRKLAHDMNQLYEENKDNLLGKFIAKLGEDSSNELNQKALEYGMKALLDSMKY